VKSRERGRQRAFPRLQTHPMVTPASRRLMWVLLAAFLLGLPFLSLSGQYVFDTRDTLWFHPTTYLIRALALWRSTPYLGHEQHDGIMVPMGIGVWLLRSLGLSMWIAERVWHGFMLFLAAGSTILLVDELRSRKTILAPVAAGLSYALTPYSFGYGLEFTPVFLPYVLLPLLLLVTLRGASRRGLVWPALFGLTTFGMGGGNGAPQVYVLLTAVVLLLWMVFVERTVQFGKAMRFALWSLAFFVGMNAYWLFLLSSPEVFNALKFSEQPDAINISSSASEAIRGLGYWLFYGGDQFGPWIGAGRAYVTFPLLVATGYAMPVAALASAWLVKWRYRLYFVFLAILAVFVSGGVFPIGSPSPYGRLLNFLYAHVPGVAGLRTTYKVTAQLTLAFAVLAGIGFEELWRRAAAMPRSIMLRGVILATVLLVIGSNSYLLWTGGLYNPARGTAAVPAYWQEALRTLDARDTDYRAFFVPGTNWTTYRWGAIKEGVLASDPTIAGVYPPRLPIAQRYGSNLVKALEGAYLYSVPAEGSAQVLRYLGVQDVVLQNDIDWQRSRTVRPTQLQLLIDDSDLQPLMTFGPPGVNVTSGLESEPGYETEGTLSPVQILSVRDPIPIVRAEASLPVVVSGDGFGIAAAARHGLLMGGPTILYSGALTSADLKELLRAERPSFIVTDTNRRWVWYFSAPRAPHSYTLPAGQTIADRPVGYLLFDDRSATQSVAVYPGLQAITASDYGAVFGTSPQFRPPNAFDGDASTWWLVGAGSNPVGAWIQATLDQPQILSRVSVSQPSAWWLRDIRRVRLEFSDGSSIESNLRRGSRTTITFPPRVVSSVRLNIMTVGPKPIQETLSGAAVSDIQIPGLNPAEIIRVPSDLLDAARGTGLGIDALNGLPFTFLFERVRGYSEGDPDEEVRISRRFEVPSHAEYQFTGTVHVNRAAEDNQIDRVIFGTQDVTVTSSSRLLGNPSLRGSAALDGDTKTSWVPTGTEGEWLTIHFPEHSIDKIVVQADVGPGRTPILRMRAVFPDGTSAYGDLADPQNGTITMSFAPRVTSSVTLFVDSVFAPFSARSNPVGISEIQISGVPARQVDPALPLPCSDEGFSLDGAPLRVRPRGTIGDLLSGAELPLGTCDGSPLAMEPGWHDLVGGGGRQPDTIILATAGTDNELPARQPLPRITASSHWDGGYSVSVEDAAGPYYLVIGQNFDHRWKASIDGEDLGPPLLLDGYSAGWRVSRVGSYTVSVSYGPQRLYIFALLLSAATFLVALGLISVHLRAIRRRRMSLGTDSERGAT
jgi:arabinofuranan 3-O-arabinosyltransferase